MKIKILHLYYDLLNLYGENGNIRAINKALECQNVKTEVVFKTINEDFNILEYDIIYIGSGSEENLIIALKDIKKRKNEFKEYIESNKYLFLTGNSQTLFGSYLLDGNKKHDCLGIFDYYNQYIENNIFKNAARNRIVGQTLSTSFLIKEKIIGFQNRANLLYNITTPLFRTNENYGNNELTMDEGFIYKNVYATHTIGPLFIRNPYLTDYFVKSILNEKKLKYKEIKDTVEKKAYKEYLKNFVNEK